MKFLGKYKKSIFACLLIVVCFSWTGSGYLTWMYRLLNFFSASNVDWLTEVIGYVFQLVGILIYSFLFRKYEITRRKHSSILLFLLDFVWIALSALAPNAISCLLFGYVMNLFHGMVAALYLHILTTQVERKKRGIVFGMGYGIGSICSWLLTLIGPKNFLTSNYVLIVYAFIVMVSVVLFFAIDNEETSSSLINDDNISTQTIISPQLLLWAGIVIFLLSTVKNLGFYFPTADLSKAGISLEFSRAFYAIGLIVAGLINDKNRKYGAICCLAALVFPFAMLALLTDVGSSLILWIMGYVFFGFFVVYRVLLFSDIANTNPSFMYLAGFGLMLGRGGDALGALLGILFKEHTTLLIICTSIGFILSVFCFFALYQKLYINISSDTKDPEQTLEDFAKTHELSPREIEVLPLIMQGHSNSEIAGILFISENTVKFHVKNILKKSNCANRTELLKQLR